MTRKNIAIIAAAVIVALVAIGYAGYNQGYFNLDDIFKKSVEETETPDELVPAKVIHLFDYEGKESVNAFGPSLIKKAEELQKQYTNTTTLDWVKYLFAAYAKPYEATDPNYPDAKVDGTCIENFIAEAMELQRKTGYDIFGEVGKDLKGLPDRDKRLPEIYEAILAKMTMKDGGIEYQNECYIKWYKALYKDAKLSLYEGKMLSTSYMYRDDDKSEFPHLGLCSAVRDGTWLVVELNGEKVYFRLDCGGQWGEKYTPTNKPQSNDEGGTPEPDDEGGTPESDDEGGTPDPGPSDPDPGNPDPGCTNPGKAPEYPGNQPTPGETPTQPSGGKAEPETPPAEDKPSPDPGGNPVPYPGSGVPAYVPGNSGTDGSYVTGDTEQP